MHLSHLESLISNIKYSNYINYNYNTFVRFLFLVLKESPEISAFAAWSPMLQAFAHPKYVGFASAMTTAIAGVTRSA